MRQYDDVAEAYATRIAPRYRAIAGLLAPRLGASPAGTAVLEIAIGSGVLTELMSAEVLDGGGSWTGLDVSVGMLRVARAALSPDIALVCADARSLPFPDAAVDLVASSLGPVQETAELFAEARRVLRSGGRLGITLWGAGYAEWHLLREPRRRIGAPDYPADPLGAARSRAQEAGFVDVEIDVAHLSVVHADLDAYVDYRAAFGRLPFVPPDRMGDWLRFIREAAADYVDAEGRVVLDWQVGVLTARRPG
jgi:SAM-dependent methyltransferase